MFGLYLLEDWNGDLRLMKASKIHKKVMDKSQKSNYNWIASATNLISVCEKKKFPEQYATDIKIAVLNCFSQLINSDDDTTRRKKTDLDAVYYAYNSLYEIQEEKAIKARTNFLNAFLLHITLCKYTFLFRGESYHKYCTEWRNKKFNELFSKENINFSHLKTTLEKEFENAINLAEKEGIFLEDDKKEQEKLNNYIKQSTDYFFESYGAPEKPKTKTLKKD